MCFLKYKASQSVWLKNRRRGSTGTSGICNFTFPCLQQKVGPSSVSLCAVQNASLANCGKPCCTDQLHLLSASQPGTICILHLKNKMISMNYILLCYCDHQINGYLLCYLYHNTVYHHPPGLSFGSWRSLIYQALHLN
jgi:hypothetical protein